MTFSVEWMQAVAASVSPGITYKGIAYEGDRPDLAPDLPNGGIDLQMEPVLYLVDETNIFIGDFSFAPFPVSVFFSLIAPKVGGT